MIDRIAVWIVLVVGQAVSTPVDPVIADARALFDQGRVDEGIATLEAGAKEAEARGASDVAADRWIAIGERERTRDRSRFAVALAAFERALSLSLAAHPTDKGDDARVASGLYGTGDCLRRVGRFAEALERSEAALAMRRRLFSIDHPDVAASLDGVANCRDALGRGEDALPQHEEALAMRRRLASGDDPDVATSLHDLAQCLLGIGRSADAMPKLEEALAIRRRIHSGDHPELAEDINGLADGLRFLNRNTEALSKTEEALAMDRRLFPGDHPDVARSVCNVGLCLDGLGRAAEALLKVEEALAMRRRLYPDGHPHVGANLNVVAIVLHRLGRYDAAIQACDEATAIRRRFYPDSHPLVATDLATLAVYLDLAGRDVEALAKHEESLAMLRRIHPADHPLVAQCVSNMASCLQDLGRNVEALTMNEEALAMYQRLSPGDDPDVANCLSLVASILVALGRPAEALPKHEAALAMSRRLHRGDHPRLALGLHNVACTLTELGRPVEALPKHEEALAMWRRIYPADHPHVAIALENLAICLSDTGHLPEALANYEEALPMVRRLYSADHPSVAHLLTNIAVTLGELGRAEDALAKSEEALAMHRRVHIGDHPDTMMSLRAVATHLRELARTAEALAMFEKSLAMGRRLYPAGHPDLVTGLRSIATIRMDDPEQRDVAADLLAEAMELVERARMNERTLDPEQRAARFSVLRESDPYPPARRLEFARGNAAAAFAIAERQNGRFFLDLLEGAGTDALDEAERGVRLGGDDARAAAIAALRTSIERVDAEDARLTREVVRIASDRGLAEDERERQRRVLAPDFAALAGEKDRCATERARVIAEFLPVMSPATPDDLRGALRPGELLLAFALDTVESHLFVVDRETVDAFAIPATRPDVARMIDGSRAPDAPAAGDAVAFASRGRRIAVATDHGSSARLFETLIPETAWKRIRGASRVFVVTDGALHRFPLETLAVAPGRTWLDDGPPIAYVPSGSVLVWLRRRSATEGSGATGAPGGTTLDVLALGDPVFAFDDPRRLIPEHGALIASVAKGSPAEQAGLLPLDVVVRFDGKDIADDDVLRDAIRSGGSRAASIAVALLRDGRPLDIEVPPGKLGIVIGRGPARVAYDLGYGRGLEEQAVAQARSAGIERFGGLQPLPATRGEALAAARAFGAGSEEHSRVLLGADATESKLFELAPKARFLHLATHGLFDEVAGNSLSALALTLPDIATAQDDGFLTLDELIHGWRGRLESCRMVVLSACETQVGVEQRDNAPFALSFGFICAGASSVISSLWAVNDASTAELMSDFYARLARAGPHADRLAEFTAAKRAMKERGESVAKWAPFVYVGSPD